MRPTKRQRAKTALAYALDQVASLEVTAMEAARTLARSKKELEHARSVLRLAREDARKAGVL